MCNNFTAVAFLLVIITTLDSFCFCTFIAKANEESGQENTREVVGSHTRTDEVAGVIFEKTQKRKLSLDDDSNNVPRFIVQKSDGTHKEFRLPEGASVIRDYCIDPQGKYMFITHQKANNLCPCTQIERGWCICGAISIIDLEKMEYVKSVLLDAVDRGAPGPWGILVDPDGKSLYIALSGSHELMVIDIQKMLQKITGYSEEKKGNIWHEIGFVDEFSRRISLPGNGPRKLEMIEGKLNVSMEFSDSSAILDFSAEEEPKIVEIRHDNKPKTPERLGEQYFNDATLSFQDWLSCASCHPDGGSDGLSWDLLVDGMGNPKKTRSLIGISKRSFYYSQATKNDLQPF